MERGPFSYSDAAVIENDLRAAGFTEIELETIALSNHTQAIARGAGFVDGSIVSLIDVGEIDDEDWRALDAADAIIFGSPTYFGSLSSDMKRFFESTVDRWVDGPRWKDKLAAGFTNSKTMSGDKLNTLFDLAAFAAQYGMIWVGLDLYPGWHTKDSSADDLNRLGSWFGVMSQSNSDEAADVVPPTSDLMTGEHLGRRVADLAVVLNRGRAMDPAAP